MTTAEADKPSQKEEKIQYTIRFAPGAVEEIEEMAKEEGITKAELIRRALNFYQVKQRATREKGRIFILNEKGEKTWVMV